MLRKTFLAAVVAVSISPSISAQAANTPSYRSFPTQDSIRLSEPDVKKSSPFWPFRTRILNGAVTNGVIFNGKYTVVTWGCGLPCQQGVVIDRKKRDNNIIFLPLSMTGYEYSFNSSQLIVNPHPEEYNNTGEIPTFLYREFYHLVGQTFVFDCADKGEGTKCLDEKEYTAVVNENN